MTEIRIGLPDPDRQKQDGRSYSYVWSDRGELPAENTQGVDVRTFEWDAAGSVALSHGPGHVRQAADEDGP
jgi:hypothetical protein